MIIGITGKSGSGKTTIANYLGSIYNTTVIHGDDLAHEVLTLDLYNEVLSWFGYPNEDKVDRKRLGSLLFQNKEVMERYNELIYQLILKKIHELLNPDGINIIDWNFLPITTFFNECDIKVLLTAPVDLRRQRVIKRDNVNNDYFELREQNGLEYNEEDYDIVIGSEEVLKDDSAIRKLVDAYYGN